MAKVNMIVTKKVARRNRKRKNADNYLNEGHAQMIKAPSAGGAILRNREPMLRPSRDKLIVSHTEPIFTVNGGLAGAFVVAQGNLAPFNFPWMNGIAVNYSKWRWLKIDLIYIPSVPTTTSGEVCMALVYDRNDTNPVSFAALQQFYRAVSGPVWAGYEGSSLLNRHDIATCPGAVVLPVDTSRFGFAWYRYITQAAFIALGSVSDQNLYLPCALVAGDQGAPGAQLLGRVFARYTIEFIEPIPASSNN